MFDEGFNKGTPDPKLVRKKIRTYSAAKVNEKTEAIWISVNKKFLLRLLIRRQYKNIRADSTAGMILY